MNNISSPQKGATMPDKTKVSNVGKVAAGKVNSAKGK